MALDEARSKGIQKVPSPEARKKVLTCGKLLKLFGFAPVDKKNAADDSNVSI